MSVSLTHVQAALQNQLTSGGSGPLTLNVLHKTDALISQLKALSHTKPLSVEVLKALPNGRAEVLTNGLKLDVKASLPLQKGEVLQLKLEQHGSAIRLVQTLGNAQGNSQGAVQGPAQGQVSQQANQGQSLGNGQQVAQTVTQTSAQNSPVNVQSQVSNTAAHQGQNAALLSQQKAATAKSNSIQTGSDKNISSNQNTHSQNLSATQTQARLPASQQAPLPQGNAGQALQQTQAQQISGNPVLANSAGVKPGLANVQLTTSALIGVLAEALPASEKRQAGRADQQTTVQSALDGKGAKRSSLQGQQLNQSVASHNKQLAETVTAKYQTTSSLSVEEIQEVQQRQPAKAPDLSLELPIAGEAKPVHVEFHIGPDPEQSNEESDDESHSLRFSLEMEGTGPVHASLTLSGQTVRVTLWAEDDGFAAKLIEHRDLLDERLAANGLDLNHFQIRHGLPPSRREQDIPHVDANI
jgi:hypothetical protein